MFSCRNDFYEILSIEGLFFFIQFVIYGSGRCLALILGTFIQRDFLFCLLILRVFSFFYLYVDLLLLLKKSARVVCLGLIKMC